MNLKDVFSELIGETVYIELIGEFDLVNHDDVCINSQNKSQTVRILNAYDDFVEVEEEHKRIINITYAAIKIFAVKD
jgi:hypothetical protein